MRSTTRLGAGPLFFSIFINDLCNISKLANFVLFADDCNMFLSSQNRHNLYKTANSILFKLYEYCQANRLIINYEKCCFIEFGSIINNEMIPLGILNKAFEPVTECKFLGVYINNTLTWGDQIKHVISQVSKSCGSLY